MQNLLKRLWQDEEGQDLVEYALLLVLIALAAAATVQTLGTAIKTVFSNASTALGTYTT
ncbi:MAG TPA: Flp family type IVb pilin [Verrucomicrobiae bacterium]|jgi:pilus assembly protein Flp/PilA|nr:Flp family type IVb pilin [Verrucomicrobiae bacterium]